MNGKLLLIIIILSLTSCSDVSIWNKSKDLRVIYEMGFYYGQKKALQGKYAVSFDGSNYYWSKNLYTFDATEEELEKHKDYDFDVRYVPPIGD